MPKLRPETQAARKTHILQAALTCFARKSYHQITMDDIVREAGLSKGGVYTHFDTKKAIFQALFEWLIADMNLLPALSAEGPTAIEKLETVLSLSIDYMTSDLLQAFSPLLLDVWVECRQDAEVNEAVMQLYDQLRQPLVQLIEEGIAAGEFKSVDATAFADILIGLFDGVMVQAMMDESAVSWRAVAQTLHDTLLAGLVTGVQ